MVMIVKSISIAHYATFKPIGLCELNSINLCDLIRPPLTADRQQSGSAISAGQNAMAMVKRSTLPPSSSSTPLLQELDAETGGR